MKNNKNMLKIAKLTFVSGFASLLNQSEFVSKFFANWSNYVYFGDAYSIELNDCVSLENQAKMQISWK